jgi:3-methyladenine DNA glycosylase/8-oxoguanine DNA glycosylase
VTDASEPLVASFEISGPVDLPRTLAPLRHGTADPTIRITAEGVWLTRRTVAGPATMRLRTAARPAATRTAATRTAATGTAATGTVRAEAWGPGAALALEAAPALAGALDRPELLEPRHPLVGELCRRFAGFRMTRTEQLLPALVPAVLGQKITATEMIRGHLGLMRLAGEPAPGPGGDMGLLVAPEPERLAALPYFELHAFGVERRRADLVRRLARRAPSLEALLALEPAEASARLRTIPGVGPWTAAEAVRVAFGDPDAISVGDAHIPSLVAWALAGEPRADDARMLEILEPYRGQRGRVVALLEAAGVVIPRHAPRYSPKRIDGI